MKNLLYIGNQLKLHHGTVTTIDVLGPLLEKEGYHLVYASSFKNKVLRFFHMICTVFKNRKKADYVFIDTYSTLNFYYAFFVSQVCRILNLKYIPILHGGNLPNKLTQSPILSKLIFKNAYVNVSPSNYIKSAFEKLGYSNLTCIPNSIEINDYPFQVKDFNTVRLLWVRSFSEIYNPLLAVKILKALLDENIHATLCMVGPDKDGSLNQTKTYAKEIGADVLFTGKLSKKDWIKLSKDYNIFINTTNFDNMPVSVIEAMALGFPVVSTDVGGMPFLIKDGFNGMLVHPNNVSAFVSVIKNLILNTEKTTQMAFNARNQAEMYDWNTIKHQWFSLLN